MTPAISNATILSVAVPLPPEMIAPACPMRLPGGAVSPADTSCRQQARKLTKKQQLSWTTGITIENTPAMNPTTGLSVPLSLRNSAAASSAVPPISPIIMIPSVSGSLTKRSKQSMKFVPLNGSPPIPTYTGQSLADDLSGCGSRKMMLQIATYHSGLAQSLCSGLIDCFICECARARHNTDLSRCVYVTWHDSNFTLAWLDDTWTIGTNEPCLASIRHGLLDFDLQNVHDSPIWAGHTCTFVAVHSDVMDRVHRHTDANERADLTMSCCGIPSVMHTTRSSSASTASRIAFAANGGGT